MLKSVSYVRAFLAQVAASFVGLVAPAAVGGMALNARFLQKAGVDPSVAVATVGVWQVMAFVVHVVMLVLFGVIAGTRAETSFDPPQGAILGVVLLILVAAVVISLPWGRRVVRGPGRPRSPAGSSPRWSPWCSGRASWPRASAGTCC